MYARHPTLQPGPPYTGGTRNILGLVIEMRHVFEGRLPASNMLQKIREKGRTLKLKAFNTAGTTRDAPDLHPVGKLGFLYPDDLTPVTDMIAGYPPVFATHTAYQNLKIAG